MENTTSIAASVKKDFVYSTVEEWTCGEHVSDEDAPKLREEALSLENPMILTDFDEWLFAREESKKEKKIGDEAREMEDGESLEEGLTSPEDLSSEWMELKNQEEELRAKRLLIEEKLIDAFGVSDEGSKTHNISEFKVRITGKMNRRLDVKAWEEIKNEIPAEFSPVEYKPQLSNSKLKEMILKDPSAYRKMCRCITSKPAKPYITIVTK